MPTAPVVDLCGRKVFLELPNEAKGQVLVPGMLRQAQNPGERVPLGQQLVLPEQFHCFTVERLRGQQFGQFLSGFPRPDVFGPDINKGFGPG